MKALAQRLTFSGRFLPHQGLFTGALLVALIGLEVLGRYSQNDLHDLLSASVLATLALCALVRHRRTPLPWLSRLQAGGRSLGLRLLNLRYEHGVDLRGHPPLPRRTPKIFAGVVLLLLAVGVTAAGLWILYPSGWRALGVQTLYLLYLPLLVTLWVLLLGFFILGVFVPIAMLDRWLKSGLGETDRRGIVVGAVVCYAVAVSLVAYVIPASAIMVLCLLLAAGAGLLYWPAGSDGPALLWRAQPNQPIFAVPLRRVLAIILAVLALLLFDLLLLSCGGQIVSASPSTDTMPITTVLGSMTAWTMPLLLGVGGFWLLNAYRHDPARRSRPTVMILGSRPWGERLAAARLLKRQGWRVRWAVNSQSRRSGNLAAAVPIELVLPEQSEAREFDPCWPLKVSLADLQDGEVLSRIARRDEIHLRRQFFRALAKLLKRATLFKGPGGGGLWLAPQWWFIEGLGREEADPGSDDPLSTKLIGPPYHRIFTPRARQHIHQVLRATQVDMIFIEDGITPRKVEKVIRTLMEIYDVHGGRIRAEEMHFRGLPKVRVMIHDYEPGNPFQSDVYPEPKFDDLSRVRVLHIFRDRGGHEEWVEPPEDVSWSPSPLSLVG